ncbi:hypothetical protein GJ496_000542 [Pomphorhynchus laevis]|nr:hypothetical protein GJ496_000542 [Pomphorhynchus laevis]
MKDKTVNALSPKDISQNNLINSSAELHAPVTDHQCDSRSPLIKEEPTTNESNLINKECTDSSVPNFENTDDLYSVAYIDVKSPPTPPSTSELAASDDAFKCMTADGNLPSQFLSSDDSIFNCSSSPVTSTAMPGIYNNQQQINASSGSSPLKTLCSPSFNSHCSLTGDPQSDYLNHQFSSCIPRYVVNPQTIDRITNRKRSGLELNMSSAAIDHDGGINGVSSPIGNSNTMKVESKPKAKRRRRRAANATSEPASTTPPDSSFQTDGTAVYAQQGVVMDNRPGSNNSTRLFSLDTDSSSPSVAVADRFRSVQQRNLSDNSIANNPIDYVASPIAVSKRRGSSRSLARSGRTPSPMMLQMMRNECSPYQQQYPSLTMRGNGAITQCVASAVNNSQHQNQVFVFSSTLANQAAESVRTGRFPTIIDFHKSLPATARLLLCLQQSGQQAARNDQQWSANSTTNKTAKIQANGTSSSITAGTTTAKDNNLTPEQLKKRQENLAKLQGIGELLNVYPSSSSSSNVMNQDCSTIVRGVANHQPFRNSPMSPSPRLMYRYANGTGNCIRPADMVGGGPRRSVMIAPNGQLVAVNDPSTMNHPLNRRMMVPATMYSDNGEASYLDCPPPSVVMTCPGTPNAAHCHHPTTAQLDWQRLQSEFFEKRAKEQQMGLMRMQNGGMVVTGNNIPDCLNSFHHPNGSDADSNAQMACVRRMMLMKAGQPERFSSAVEFLRRTGYPPNVFNAGCEMQICPSPKEMNYEIDGQELVITKQPNNHRRATGSSGSSGYINNGGSVLMSASSTSSSLQNSGSNSELAPPLSSMLEMTNSIPQPTTSPPVVASITNMQQQSNQASTSMMMDNRIIEENRITSSTTNTAAIIQSTKQSKIAENESPSMTISPAKSNSYPKTRSTTDHNQMLIGSNSSTYSLPHTADQCHQSSSNGVVVRNNQFQQQNGIMMQQSPSNYNSQHPSRMMVINQPTYKMQQPSLNVRHYYPVSSCGSNGSSNVTNNSVPACYFDEYGGNVPGSVVDPRVAHHNISANHHHQVQHMHVGGIDPNNTMMTPQPNIHQAANGGGCHAILHGGGGPPSVNNTYVNATMSIQQLNIQSVQPPPTGPQSVHHQQVNNQQHTSNMYGQQQPTHNEVVPTASQHHPHQQHLHNPHHLQYINGVAAVQHHSGTPQMSYNPIYDGMNQQHIIPTGQIQSRLMMDNMQQMNYQHPHQMVIMRGSTPNRVLMQPRIAAAAPIRYDPQVNCSSSVGGGPSYNNMMNSPQGIMMCSSKSEYPPRMTSMLTQQQIHDMQCAAECSNSAGSSNEAAMMSSQYRMVNRKVGMHPGSTSMMTMQQNDYCRDRMMMQQQMMMNNSGGNSSGIYNAGQIMMTVTDNNLYDHGGGHMMGMMSNTVSEDGGSSSMIGTYSYPQQGGPSSSMMLAMTSNSDSLDEGNEFATMDKVSKRLAEAGMMFTADPLLESLQQQDYQKQINSNAPLLAAATGCNKYENSSNTLDSQLSHAEPQKQQKKHDTSQNSSENDLLQISSSATSNYVHKPSTTTLCKDDI